MMEVGLVVANSLKIKSFYTMCLMIRGTLCVFSKSFDPSAVNEKKAGNSAFKIKLNDGSQHGSNAKTRGRKSVSTFSVLPETAVSVTVAATIVVAAATFLGSKTKTSDVAEAPTKTCEACGGSGICSQCNGEGFMLKKMSDESAEKARLLAKNMASRYTAGLPKKWSYCTKCASGRSCSTCGGSGKLSS